MEPALILLLIFCIGFCALYFYLGFIAHQPIAFLRDNSRTAAIVFFLLVGCVVFGITRQSGDQSRLEALGITPHPGIEHSIGVPAGPGIDPTWVFQASAPRETVLEFYRREENRPGWSLVSDGAPVMLVLEKEGRRLTIGATEASADTCTLSFLLSDRR